MEHVDDYLVPYLMNLRFPETLSATDVENLIAKCLQEFKENRKAVANSLKHHHKKVEQNFTHSCHGLLFQQEPSVKYEYHRSLTLFSNVCT